MASAVITLSSPQEYDLHSLAETTRQSLALLKPWTLIKPSPDNALVGEIAAQATKYVAAIQMGVSAAYSGFTVTEEILFLASAFPIEDQEDLQRYLVGMMELAKEARDNANKAYDAFRNVRQEIYAITSEVEAEALGLAAENGDATTREGLPDYHRKDIDVLVKFADHISTFANWWDWVKIETDPSGSKDQPISFQIDTLRDPEVVKRWHHLRSQYTAYVHLIGEMEDTDPQFFRRSSTSPVPQSVPDPTNRPESPSNSSSSSGAQKHTAPHNIKPTTSQPSPPPPSTEPSKALNEATADNLRADTEPKGKDKKGIRARFSKYFKDNFPSVAKKVKNFKHRSEKSSGEAAKIVDGLRQSGFGKFKKARAKASMWISAGRHESQCTSVSLTGKEISDEPAAMSDIRSQGPGEPDAASVNPRTG